MGLELINSLDFAMDRRRRLVLKRRHWGALYFKTGMRRGLTNMPRATGAVFGVRIISARTGGRSAMRARVYGGGDFTKLPRFMDDGRHIGAMRRR